MAGGEGGGGGRADGGGSCGGAPGGIAHCTRDGPDSPPPGSRVEGGESQAESEQRSWWRTEILRISYAPLLF